MAAISQFPNRKVIAKFSVRFKVFFVGFPVRILLKQYFQFLNNITSNSFSVPPPPPLRWGTFGHMMRFDQSRAGKIFDGSLDIISAIRQNF